MSTPPKVLSAHVPSSRAWLGFVRSHGGLTAGPLSRSISATTCPSGSLRGPARATRAPSAAGRGAVARPMPEPPPVTRAILPSSVFMVSSVAEGCPGSAGAPRVLGGLGAVWAPHVLGAQQPRRFGADALDLVDGLGRA